MVVNNYIFFTGEWMVRVEVKKCHRVSGFFLKFCLEFCRFREIDI